MTRYLRTAAGYEMTVHAPRPGELDRAALAGFTVAEPVLGTPQDPTFSYPGDPECSITYGSNQAGTTTWAATVTESGELITHASDNQATSTGATPR